MGTIEYEVCINYQGQTRIVFTSPNFNEANAYRDNAEKQLEKMYDMEYYYIRKVEVQEYYKKQKRV